MSDEALTVVLVYTFMCCRPNRKIFIGGLSYETTDGMLCYFACAVVDGEVLIILISLVCASCPPVDKLRSYFGAYGAVTDAVVMKDPISRRSRGFGFITYADPSCVDRALAQPNHILDSRRVRGS